MATQAKNRPKLPTPAPAVAEPTLPEIFDERDRYTRRGDVELIGQVLFIACETDQAGLQSMEFRQAGPMLARLTDGPQKGDYVFLQQWQGLPALTKLKDEPCDVCRVTCDQCQGTKQARCGHVGCGGAGEIATSWQACPACAKRGKARPTCKQCHGKGQIPFEKHVCPTCQGKKKVPCVRCQASGKMATGQIDGKRCDACLGNARKVDFVEQDWKQFCRGELEGYFVLGPIVSMTLLAPPDEGPGFVGMECRPDLDGNFPVLLTKTPAGQTAGRAYLFGGVINKAQ